MAQQVVLQWALQEGAAVIPRSRDAAKLAANIALDTEEGDDWRLRYGYRTKRVMRRLCVLDLVRAAATTRNLKRKRETRQQVQIDNGHTFPFTHAKSRSKLPLHASGR